MRSLTRQSARWAPSTARNTTRHSQFTRTPLAAQPSIPSSPNLQQSRPFHQSVKTASSSDPRIPPRGSATENEFFTPAERQREDQRSRSNAEPEASSASASHSSKIASDSPLRNKTLRQRRAAIAGTQNVPSPPPIPDWFLQHNVELNDRGGETVGDKSTTTSSESRQTELKQCIDTVTGEVLFAIEVERPNRADMDTEVRTNDKGALVDKDGKEISAVEWALQRGIQGWEETSDAPRKREQVPPRTWVDLDIQLGAHGAMSLGSQNQASYAASRVDISLICSDAESHGYLDRQMREIATHMGADLVRIDANDLEELAGEYVGQGHDAPGSFSTVAYDAFEDYSATQSESRGTSRPQPREEEEDEMDDEDEASEDQPAGLEGIPNISNLRKALHERRHDLAKALQGTGIAGFSIGVPKMMNAASGPMLGRGPAKSSSQPSEYVSWDDARLVRLLDSLIDAPQQKRNSVFLSQKGSSVRSTSLPISTHETQNSKQESSMGPSEWRTIVGQALMGATSRLEPHQAIEYKATNSKETGSSVAGAEQKSTIIHVRDLKDICRSKLGETIIRRLVRVVQRRRRTGQKVMVMGTTASSDVEMFASFGPEDKEDLPFRTLTMPPHRRIERKERLEMLRKFGPGKQLIPPAYSRILEVNLRHMQAMLRRLRPDQNPDLLSKTALDQMNIDGTHFLTVSVLPYEQVQRIVLSAIGLAQAHAKSDIVQPIHFALAASIVDRAKEFVRFESSVGRMKSSEGFVPLDGGEQHFDDVNLEGQGFSNIPPAGKESKPARIDIEKIRKSCNSHEARLLNGVVDAQNIKTGFSDVHAPAETIEALKTLTSLSLLRPDAFKYGVLANDRLPGLLLYGPPGTGKTLLARAVAKESQATVLEVTGAQIYEKYVGEGEKMVRAVFSLAKKLSPCIVFIDEADAIFGSRSGSGGMGERNSHRELINQFLREWDGMDSHHEKDIFIMVATNRPFDLDDAVLRRLPRRLLVDLPTPKDRESILGIHLKGEALAEEVQLSEMAKQTPLYSGSDLKNLCVSAALACVREENELVAAATAASPATAPSTDTEATDCQPTQPTYTLPAKRTLQPKHFTRALAEISASISEDMASLTAIRKFDEQYGDRQGRRKKKAGLGFGMASTGGAGSDEAAIDEAAARVRQGDESGRP